MSVTATGDLVIALQPDFHSRYGCVYPMTYQVEIPQGSSGLKIQRKYLTEDMWREIPEKTSNDLFNGILFCGRSLHTLRGYGYDDRSR